MERLSKRAVRTAQAAARKKQPNAKGALASKHQLLRKREDTANHVQSALKEGFRNTGRDPLNPHAFLVDTDAQKPLLSPGSTPLCFRL
jgi:hypothetical protein